MKIAVTGTRGFPGVQGGVESHCEKLYSHLAAKSCDITVFTRKDYVSRDLGSYEGISLIPVSCPRNKFIEALIHTFKSILSAWKLKPDVLHIHAIGPSFFTPFARLLGMKVVVTNHGPDYRRQKWPLPAKIFLKLCEWMGMTFAHEVIAIAKNIADDIESKFGRQATVIPNGVEIPSPVDTNDALKKYGLKKKYILAVGRLVPEKGFDYLIDAFNEGKFDNWKLVIVGSADHEDRYSRRLRTKASVSRDVILTGFLTGRPLSELYNFAGLFVLPSYYEGLPIVLLEAMSYGISCIAADIRANRNVGLSQDRFFKVGDVKELACKIREFTDRPWDEEDRKRQINMIREKHSWEKIADKTLEIYKQVAS